jgi:hypothetical protein
MDLGSFFLGPVFPRVIVNLYLIMLLQLRYCHTVFVKAFRMFYPTKSTQSLGWIRIFFGL